MFWQRSLTTKQLLHGAKGRKQLLHGAKGRETANTHPESAFGWVLIGRALGRLLTPDEPPSPKFPRSEKGLKRPRDLGLRKV